VQRYFATSGRHPALLADLPECGVLVAKHSEQSEEMVEFHDPSALAVTVAKHFERREPCERSEEEAEERWSERIHCSASVAVEPSSS
jgi:hypothetical protein